VSSGFFEDLVRWKELARERGDRRQKVESPVIYGGNERQAREPGRLIPWRAVEEVDRC